MSKKQNQNDDDEYVMISALTDKQWLEIKSIAVQLYNSGQLERDHLKCSVIAFVQWLLKNNSKNIVIDEDKDLAKYETSGKATKH